jgi:HTH-type transcriptional regulator, sugar sensing transcriptional regulator
MNKEIFKQIGFTDGETKVYLALLKLGSTTAGPLTHKSRVSRSKVYEILEKLMEKGLVSFIIKEKTKYFQAAEPSKIQDYLEKKEKEFQKQKQEFDKILPQLELQQKMEKTEKMAQIFTGFKGIQTVHQHLFSRLKKGEEYVYIGIPSLQEEKYVIYWDRMHLRRIKAGINCKLLFNQGTDKKHLEKRNKQKGCEARYMSIPIKTPAWIMVYKDTTAIGLPSDEEMAIEIVNQKVADSFKEYFQAFWKLSKTKIID